MRKALGSTVLTATLVGAMVMPAHGIERGQPGADTPESPATMSALATRALAPAAAAKLRPSLVRGTRGPAVVYVQRTLGVTPASGYYGSATRQAVTTLQRRKGLRPTGKVGAATWRVLLGTTSEAPATGTGGAKAPAASPTPDAAAKGRPALALGARGPAVVYVQRTLGVSPASGYYGTLTRAAVTALQGQRGLKATGTVDRATWKVLLAARGVISLPAPEPTTEPAAQPAVPTSGTPGSPPVPEPVSGTVAVQPAPLTPADAAAARPPLKPGMGPGDPAVVFVQEFLRVSPATGFFGRLTTGAVKAYQQGLGIRATGRVGPLTWEAIATGRAVATEVAAPATAPAPVTATPPVAPAAPSPSAATIPTPAYPLPANPTAGDTALVYALAQVGKPYVLGGNGPRVFDCSGLVQQAYLTAGVRLPRLASQQRFAGTTVTLDTLLPGDLLYYQDGSSPRRGHISMYAGNGLVVEAANPRRGVRIRTLNEPWYRDRFVAAVRIG